VILLDENIVEEQRAKVRAWKTSTRQLGYEIGRKGLKDYEVIPILQRIRNATFLTSDRYKPNLWHKKYCLVWFDVHPEQFAVYARMFLSHKYFKVQRNRMGTIIRVQAIGMNVIAGKNIAERFVPWN
jgi:hypothetical protein